MMLPLAASCMWSTPKNAENFKIVKNQQICVDGKWNFQKQKANMKSPRWKEWTLKRASFCCKTRESIMLGERIIIRWRRNCGQNRWSTLYANMSSAHLKGCWHEILGMLTCIWFFYIRKEYQKNKNQNESGTNNKSYRKEWQR